MALMVPELIPKDEIVYPHEMIKSLPDEAHFKRTWQHYREFTFKSRFAQILEEGEITQEEADNFVNFVEMNNIPSLNLYIYAKLG